MSESGIGASNQGHWANLRESGSYFGIQFCYWVYRVFGRWLVQVLLVPVMGYFLLANRVARQSSLEYLTQLARWRPAALTSRPGMWLAYRHFLAFGEAVLDKVVGWSGGVTRDQIEFIDLERYVSIKSDGRGRLLMGSHFGNLEYCRAFATQASNITLNVLMHDRHAGNFNRVLKRADPSSRLNLYAVADLDFATILELKEKVSAGQWVVIAADRVPVKSMDRTVPVDFMGRQAQLPIGPYVLASTLECPVSLIFGWREPAGIAVTFEHFAERIEIPRKGREERLIELAQQFADRLSEYCARAPLQWFNFYPFWDEGVADDGSTGS
jgi:predicted LPLAT superfamily acyltransferase